MLSLSLLYDEAIHSLSTFFSLYLMRLSCILLAFFLSLSLSIYFPFSSSLPFPFPLCFSLFGSMIGDFKLPLNFIMKPHSAPTALVASCQTHSDMLAHTQAHANMPPEPFYSGFLSTHPCQKTAIEKGALNEKQQKENWKFLIC